MTPVDPLEMTSEPAAVLKTLRAQIEEVATQLMQRLDGLGFTLTRELWLKDAPLEIADALEKFVATYAAAQRQADNELQKAVLAERYQEGREDGIGWAQRANDDIIADLRAQLAAAQHNEELTRGEEETLQRENNRLLAQLTASEAAREQARQEFHRLLDDWEAAYPEDVFRPFIAADHPNVSPDRIAAEMGRHMARELRKQLQALTPGAAADRIGNASTGEDCNA